MAVSTETRGRTDILSFAHNLENSMDGCGPPRRRKSLGPHGKGEQVDIIDIREDSQLPPLGDAIRDGLTSHNDDGYRSFPSLLLWDEQGLKHFEQVTYNPEYYLTNTEISLLEAHSNSIAQRIKPGTILLELGSGNLRKIKILLQAIEDLGTSIDYYALDLDASELSRTLHQLAPTKFHHVRCHGLLGTYDDGRRWLSTPTSPAAQRPKCILSLGSTIGSFTRSEAREFLHQWTSALSPASNGDSLIIALDACKKGDKVFAAYNDGAGANKAFILNALAHANAQLGYEAFRHREWTVRGEWDAEGGSHNQYLVPLVDVEFEGTRVGMGEKVFLVRSVKYGGKERGRLWTGAGATEVRAWENDEGDYGVFILEPGLPN